jgi:hypothetical protein
VRESCRRARFEERRIDRSERGTDDDGRDAGQVRASAADIYEPVKREPARRSIGRSQLWRSQGSSPVPLRDRAGFALTKRRVELGQPPQQRAEISRRLPARRLSA